MSFNFIVFLRNCLADLEFFCFRIVYQPRSSTDEIVVRVLLTLYFRTVKYHYCQVADEVIVSLSGHNVIIHMTLWYVVLLLTLYFKTVK